MHSTEWPRNEDRKLDRLRVTHDELGRLNDQLKNLPPRHRAEAAPLIAANEAVLLSNARYLSGAGARIGTDFPRRNVRSVTEGYCFLPHHNDNSH